MFPGGRRPIRVVLRWQAVSTVLIAAAAFWFGANAGLSALLGGAISIVATLAFAVVATMGRSHTAGFAVLSVLRAEGVKVLVIVILLWLVMMVYKELVPTVFIATFIVAVLIQSMAFFVRET